MRPFTEKEIQAALFLKYGETSPAERITSYSDWCETLGVDYQRTMQVFSVLDAHEEYLNDKKGKG